MAVPGRIVQKEGSSSTNFQSSDTKVKIYCQPCDLDGQRLSANGYCTDCNEHLCESCFKHHKKHKLSRHHILLDKDSMPKTFQVSSTPVHDSQTDELTTPCPKHKKEMIKFYCHDHKALLCSVCVTLQHTSTSCKVNYIPDISCQIINSKEHQDILKAMNTITEQCRTKLEEMKKMTSKSNISLIDVLAGINKFRKEISQRLDELERKAEDAANAIQQENNKNLDKVEAACDDKTKSLKKASDSIKHLHTSNQAERLFLELKLAEKMIKAYEKSIHNLNAYDLREFSFQPNIAILLSLKTEKSLGTLTHKSLNMQSRQALHQKRNAFVQLLE